MMYQFLPSQSQVIADKHGGLVVHVYLMTDVTKQKPTLKDILVNSARKHASNLYL